MVAAVRPTLTQVLKKAVFIPFQAFSGKINWENQHFRASRNQRFSLPPTMLGSSIRQFGRSLYPVTWSLPSPISNPVLVPPEYAYRNVVIGTICNTQCSPNAIPIGQAFCGSFRTFQYCISF